MWQQTITKRNINGKPKRVVIWPFTKGQDGPQADLWLWSSSETHWWTTCVKDIKTETEWNTFLEFWKSKRQRLCAGTPWLIMDSAFGCDISTCTCSSWVRIKSKESPMGTNIPLNPSTCIYHCSVFQKGNRNKTVGRQAHGNNLHKLSVWWE